MDNTSYRKFKDKGDAAQELFIEFMEKHGGRKFVAGDRNGKVVNIDMIEEILRCTYIPPNSLYGQRHGPKVFFDGQGNPDGYRLPDELFTIVSKERYELIDVKNRATSNLQEDYNKIKEYAEIERFSGIASYVALVIWNRNEKGYDIYIRRAKDILTDNNIYKSYDKCVFYLDKFSKINSYAIPPNS